MAEEDQEQKTEHPTGRRLDEARGKGQLPISREVSALVMMIAILMVLGLMAPVMAGHLVTYLQAFIAMPESIHLSLSGVQNLLFEAVLHVGLATGLIFAFLLTVAVLGTMVQTGFFYAPHLLMPDLSRLNPIRGWKKLFSPMGLVEFFKSVAKMSVLGLVAYFVLKPIVGQLSLMPGRDLLGTMVYMHRKTVHLILMLALTFMWIAIPDLLYQRWHYIKMLRMSKEEV
ncbi:MAG TPA: EscU/YscU/HrcU family type III secretion system export apparatus switch protein, partial [Alphaproteobacteria bacterium]|nr:EscU/YscU/HrcU family type III secretion system export apparatus switch protein [Alphaproteobacteria bacterium]